MRQRKWTACLTAAVWFAACGCRSEAPTSGRTAQPAKQLDANGTITISADSPKLRQIGIVAVETCEAPEDTVTAPGKVEVNPNRVSRVLMPVPGRVRTVAVKLGDAVAEGQVVLTVESQEANAAVAAYSQAEARLRQARSAQAKIEKDLARARTLFEHRAAAQKEVTAAENDLVQAQAEVQSGEAEVAEARDRLEVLGLRPGVGTREVAVRAPISGKVLDIAVAPGEYRTDTSASLMTVADLNSVWITSNVPEESIRLIEVNEPVDIVLVAYPNETFHGRVTRISDALDPETRTVKVHVEMANPQGRFRPEMFGRISHSHGFRRLPAVPVGAVVLNGQGAFVYRERSRGVFEKVRVRPEGLRNGLYPIAEGLTPGDRVVADGALLLSAAD